MTKIEWTEAKTLFGAPLPRRCRKCRLTKDADAFHFDRSRRDGISYVCRECNYVRLKSDSPGTRERLANRAKGLGWCSGCRAWLATSAVSRGKCLECKRRIDRGRYAVDVDYRNERRRHAQLRKRGIVPAPLEGQELLTFTFDGLCAYCDDPATTWDHVVPVIRGGQTTPDNILPACVRCNSSKRDRDLLEWIDATGRTLKLEACERLAHYQVL